MLGCRLPPPQVVLAAQPPARVFQQPRRER